MPLLEWSSKKRQNSIVFSQHSTVYSSSGNQDEVKDRTRTQDWGSDTMVFNFWVQIELNLSV